VTNLNSIFSAGAGALGAGVGAGEGVGEGSGSAQPVITVNKADVRITRTVRNTTKVLLLVISNLQNISFVFHLKAQFFT
jgi:hypothetical protein